MVKIPGHLHKVEGRLLGSKAAGSYVSPSSSEAKEGKYM